MVMLPLSVGEEQVVDVGVEAAFFSDDDTLLNYLGLWKCGG